MITTDNDDIKINHGYYLYYDERFTAQPMTISEFELTVEDVYRTVCN